jgi:hypothetical protein
MHDPLLVHVFQGTRDLLDKVPDLDFLERGILLLSIFQKSFEVALLSPLCHNDELIAPNERAQVLDDVRMVKRLHQLNLF